MVKPLAAAYLVLPSFPLLATTTKWFCWLWWPTPSPPPTKISVFHHFFQLSLQVAGLACSKFSHKLHWKYFSWKNASLLRSLSHHRELARASFHYQNATVENYSTFILGLETSLVGLQWQLHISNLICIIFQCATGWTVMILQQWWWCWWCGDFSVRSCYAFELREK